MQWTNTTDYDWQMTDPTSRQRGPPQRDRTVTFKQEETSGHESQPGFDAKTDRLIDRQSQCDFDFERKTLPCGGGSNTSTVTLRVVGGDEKASLESETVKYGHEFYGTRTRKWLRWRAPAKIVNDRPVLSSERAPEIKKPATVRQ
jgi:hypothetical protein